MSRVFLFIDILKVVRNKVTGLSAVNILSLSLPTLRLYFIKTLKDYDMSLRLFEMSVVLDLSKW